MALLTKTSARDQRERDFSRRRQIFDGREGHKGNVFSELRIACIKDPKGLQGNSEVKINDEITTVVERNSRKIAHNSAVKIEATTGREMNTSKSGKKVARPTPHYQYR